MKVIALSGWRGSGKDLVGRYLVDNYGFTRIAFADILKDMVATQYDIPRSWCDDPIYKESPLQQYPVSPRDSFSEKIHDIMRGEFRTMEDQECWTPRALCIFLGSSCRSVDSNYWVNQAIDNMSQSFHFGNDKFVITDMRYRSEVSALRSYYGDNLTTVRINRLAVCPSSDPSETDLNESTFDLTIENKIGKEELFMKLNEFLKEKGFTEGGK